MSYLWVWFELLIYIIESNQLGLRQNLEIDQQTIKRQIFSIYVVTTKTSLQKTTDKDKCEP